MFFSEWLPGKDGIIYDVTWPYISGMTSQINGNSILLNSLFRPIKLKMKAPNYWCFVKGIHRAPKDSPHKGPLMRKAFPCQDVPWIQWRCVVPSRCFATHVRYAWYPLACNVIRHGWRKIGSNYLMTLNVLSSNLLRIKYSWIWCCQRNWRVQKEYIGACADIDS